MNQGFRGLNLADLLRMLLHLQQVSQMEWDMEIIPRLH